jgi:hypothetical protein
MRNPHTVPVFPLKFYDFSLNYRVLFGFICCHVKLVDRTHTINESIKLNFPLRVVLPCLLDLLAAFTDHTLLGKLFLVRFSHHPHFQCFLRALLE